MPSKNTYYGGISNKGRYLSIEKKWKLQCFKCERRKIAVQNETDEHKRTYNTFKILQTPKVGKESKLQYGGEHEWYCN